MQNRTEEQITAGWVERSPVLVSVCCITYNHEDYIRQAIDSFLMQETDFPFEIIVHDDASTDGTAEIVSNYAKQYPRLVRTVFQSENQFSKNGLIGLRFAIPEARGKYIALCEGDDYWTDNTKLQQQVEFLEDNPDYVITYSDCRPFDESGFLDYDCGGATEDLEPLDLQKAASISTLTACFRNVIGEVPQELMSARYGDLVTWSLLGHHGKGKFLPNIKPSAYRMHGAGLHSRRDDRTKAAMRFKTVRALAAYYDRTGNPKLARFFKIRMLMSKLSSMGFGSLYGVARSAYRVSKNLESAYKARRSQQ